MIITGVERQVRRRGRVDVYVDGALRFDVAREVARTRGLRPGRRIEAAEIEAIVALDQRRQALDAAVAMLARRPRSEREVRQRLRMRKFAAPLIDETVEKLRSAELIDDAEFARAWAESRDRSSPRGRRLIMQELRAFGVAAPVAVEAAASVSDADAAYRVAAKRSRSLASLDYVTFRNRLGAQLQRRGFGWETARAAVERCWREFGRPSPEDDLEGAIE